MSTPRSASTTGHLPVMLGEVLATFGPRDGAIYVDGTFGGGGYSRALLEAADCTVWGIDRDADALARGAGLAERFAGRLHLVAGSFGAMDELIGHHGIDAVDGIALDIGVSSMQLDTPQRGFSFRLDGPLDMRMSNAGPSAADVINDKPERPLADIIFRYGEERYSRRIARAIVAARQTGRIERTEQLADIVRRAYPANRRGGRIDPATRTFQAIRIHVNDEIGELVRGLAAAEALLGPGGRLAVVSFHSLEDREIKSFLRARAGAYARGSRHAPPSNGAAFEPTFRLLHRAPVVPTATEVETNPRARSARLRSAERTAAPSWSEQSAGDAA